MRKPLHGKMSVFTGMIMVVHAEITEIVAFIYLVRLMRLQPLVVISLSVIRTAQTH